MRTLLLALLLSMAPALQASTFDHQHQAWTTLLHRHVSWVDNGHASVVDYEALRKDSSELDSYLDTLSGVSQAEYQRWNRAQRLAFLINAYNAFTVKLVVEHYPVDSIKSIGSLFTSPWERKFIPILGQTLSLDEIEHGLIREPGVFDEPRIHFAVNCASIGCPALRDEAFTADLLEKQLEDSQTRFLSDASRNRFNSSKGHFEVSKIFDWYGADFEDQWG